METTIMGYVGIIRYFSHLDKGVASCLGLRVKDLRCRVCEGRLLEIIWADSGFFCASENVVAKKAHCQTQALSNPENVSKARL